MSSNLLSGFSAATVIPALASALKQSQREAADHLHLLAAYYQRQHPHKAAAWLSPAERQAACEVGVILVEQGFNCAVLFLAVNGAALVAGPAAGMAVQVGITWNTMVTPDQSQKVNPARRIAAGFRRRPDWLARLPERQIERFALRCGEWATRCGYGAPGAVDASPAPSGRPA